ncbi:type IX secretion system protein PorQ [bacterium]|nr:type IX secretion system protein PorQ [bacterium]
MKSHALRSLLPLLLVITMAGQASAQENAVFDFLRMPMNARAAALGNTYLTARNDASMLFSNPGALSSIEGPQASVGFVKHLLDINAGYAVYAQEMKDIGWVSAGITYVNYGSFDETDKFGNTLGSFGASDLALSLGYGNRTGNLHYGGALKMIYSYIEDYSASGVAVDAGVSYYIPDQQMVLAAGIFNAGTQISSFGEENETLPFDVRLGIGKKLEHLPLTVMLNFHKLNEEEDDFFARFKKFSIGGEFELSSVLLARVGYNNEQRSELKIGNSAKLAGFSGGFGILISNYVVDYAYNSFGEIGSMHRFSISATL